MEWDDLYRYTLLLVTQFVTLVTKLTKAVKQLIAYFLYIWRYINAYMCISFPWEANNFIRNRRNSYIQCITSSHIFNFPMSTWTYYSQNQIYGRLNILFTNQFMCRMFSQTNLKQLSNKFAKLSYSRTKCYILLFCI